MKKSITKGFISIVLTILLFSSSMLVAFAEPPEMPPGENGVPGGINYSNISHTSANIITNDGTLEDETYESITGADEWKKYRDDFVNFFRFTRVMFGLHKIFEPSTYASQSVCTEITKATYDILKEKSDAICKEYEEMRS